MLTRLQSAYSSSGKDEETLEKLWHAVSARDRRQKVDVTIAAGIIAADIYSFGSASGPLRVPHSFRNGCRRVLTQTCTQESAAVLRLHLVDRICPADKHQAPDLNQQRVWRRLSCIARNPDNLGLYRAATRGGGGSAKTRTTASRIM